MTTSEPEIDAYVVCATPRSGSTLLCGLLSSSGVAGRPASYFRRESLDEYAASWHVDRPADGRIDQAYVRAAACAGRTPNGVFGVRIMGETMPELIQDLTAAGVGGTGPTLPGLGLLTAELGRTRYVHLRRRDVVAQAVSLARAQQTHYWHPGEELIPGGAEPRYDAQLIAHLVDRLRRLEASWRAWFGAAGVVPYRVSYEELAAEPIPTARAVLDFLGLELPPGRELSSTQRRQADELNADWIRRFRAASD